MKLVSDDPIELENKRRVASSDGCKADLERELPLLFQAFKSAFQSYEKEIVLTPVDCRVISLEASLLNSKMIQSIRVAFPNNCRFGKYKRFILGVNGYTILFKKLNRKDMPMNIKTNYAAAISNQLVMPLLNESFGSIDPILFFGYKKNKFGDIYDPKLVYIDENKISFTITEDEINVGDTKVQTIIPVATKAMPKLKGIASKKAVNANE